MVRTLISLILVADLFCITIPTISAQGATGSAALEHRQPGRMELLIARHGSPTCPGMTGSGPAVSATAEDASQPSLLWPVIGGVASKVGEQLIFLFYDLDIWHAAPAVFLLDPLITAFGVHAGNRYEGSFVLDLLVSYTSFYAATYLAYGTFFGTGILDDEPENWNRLYLSMGFQLTSTIVIERLISGKKR